MLIKQIKGMSKSNLKLFRQFYFVYPQINGIASRQFKLINQKSQSLTDQFKNPQISQTLTDQFKIQQTVSVKSVTIPTERLFYEVETIKGNKQLNLFMKYHKVLESLKC